MFTQSFKSHKVGQFCLISGIIESKPCKFVFIPQVIYKQLNSSRANALTASDIRDFCKIPRFIDFLILFCFKKLKDYAYNQFFFRFQSFLNILCDPVHLFFFYNICVYIFDIFLDQSKLLLLDFILYLSFSSSNRCKL